MKPIQHKSSNDVLKAPKGVSIEECHALYITRVKTIDASGWQGVVSYWQPNETERKLLADGAAVAVVVDGQTHPPIYLTVDGESVL